MEPCAATPGMLFYILHRAHVNAVQSAISAAGLADLGSPMILMLLRDWEKGREPPAQRELAEAFHVTPATIAMSLKSLERGGYVEKATDPRDQRRKRVVITVKGCSAVDTCQRLFEEVDRQMMAGFTREEQDLLEGYQRRMLENLQIVDGRPEHDKERKECQC